MVKVLVVMALAAVLLGVGVHYGKDRVESAISHAIDTGLPGKVQAHAWAPVSHGKPVAGQRILFDGDQVTTKRCHGTLGSYSLHIDHQFAFQPTAGKVKAGCPGRALRTALSHATRAKVEAHGKNERLLLTNDDGHVVATLQG
jgi:hypothetical protein